MDHVSRVGVFIEVAKRESFAGAARALGTTGPAISKQVKSLEDKLGVKLLNRTTRHVSLTEEGAVYFERARKALEDLSEAEHQIQELKACPTGKLKINAPMSFGRQFLVQPIASFAKKYPDIELEVDFDDRWVDIIEEGYDVVIRIAVLEDSSLIARKLASCPIVLCASKSLVKEFGLPSSPDALAAYPGIVYTRHSQSEDWRYQGPDGNIGFQNLSRNFAANSGEMGLEACLQGIGVALLPIFGAAQYLESGELLELLPEYKTYPERGIYAVFPKNRYLATRVRLFVDALTQCSEEFPW